MEYEKLKFDDVRYVGTCNERLILMIYYRVGDDIGDEEIFILPDGRYYFRFEGSRLKRFWDIERISDEDYNLYSKCIIAKANGWCENLGWHELTFEI